MLKRFFSSTERASSSSPAQAATSNNAAAAAAAAAAVSIHRPSESLFPRLALLRVPSGATHEDILAAVANNASDIEAESVLNCSSCVSADKFDGIGAGCIEVSENRHGELNLYLLLRVAVLLNQNLAREAAPSTAPSFVVATSVETGEADEDESIVDNSFLVIAALLVFSGAVQPNEFAVEFMSRLIGAGEQAGVVLSKRRANSQLQLLKHFQLMFLLPSLPPSSVLLFKSIQLHTHSADPTIALASAESSLAFSVNLNDRDVSDGCKWSFRSSTIEIIFTSPFFVANDVTLRIEFAGRKIFALSTPFLVPWDNNTSSFTMRESEFDQKKYAASDPLHVTNLQFHWSDSSSSSSSSFGDAAHSAALRAQQTAETERAVMLETLRRTPARAKLEMENFDGILSPRRGGRHHQRQQPQGQEDDSLEDSADGDKLQRRPRRPVATADFLAARRQMEPLLFACLEEFRTSNSTLCVDEDPLESLLRRQAGAPSRKPQRDTALLPHLYLGAAAPQEEADVPAAPTPASTELAAPNPPTSTKHVDPSTSSYPSSSGARSVLEEMLAKRSGGAPATPATAAAASSVGASAVLAEMLAKRAGGGPAPVAVKPKQPEAAVTTTTPIAASSAKDTPEVRGGKSSNKQIFGKTGGTFRPPLTNFPALKSGLIPIPGAAETSSPQPVAPAPKGMLPAPPAGMASVLAQLTGGKAPPSTSSAAAASCAKKPAQPKLKTLFWKKLSAPAPVFTAAAAVSSSPPPLLPDEAEIRELFTMVPTTAAKEQNSSSTSGKGNSGLKSSTAISANRKQALLILLTKMQLLDTNSSEAPLAASILRCDPAVCSDKFVEPLSRIVPLPDEIKALKVEKEQNEKNAGAVVEWGEAERTMWALAQISEPDVKTRLSLLKSFSTLETSIQSAQLGLGTLRHVVSVLLCEQDDDLAAKEDGEARRCAGQLRCILQFVLRIGNFLNKGTAQSCSSGFHLSSLGLLSKTIAPGSGKGKKKSSLLDVICAQFLKQQQQQQQKQKGGWEGSSSSSSSMAPLMALLKESRSSLASLSSSISALNVTLQRTQREAERKSALSAKENDGFVQVARKIASKWGSDIVSLVVLEQQTAGEVSGLLEFFGVAADTDEQGLFSILLEFLREWESARENFLRETAAAEKQQQQQQQQDKKSLSEELLQRRKSVVDCFDDDNDE